MEILIYFYVALSILQLTHSGAGDSETTIPPPSIADHVPSGKYNMMFTLPTSTRKAPVSRTTTPRISFAENCDFLAKYCLKGYETGTVCGRSLYYTYHTFDNYCLLDYVNCMDRYQVWQVAYMGACYTLIYPPDPSYVPYHDDYFLEQYYVNN